MPSNLISLLASIAVANFQNVDFIVAFDKVCNKLYAISVKDCITKAYHNSFVVTKASQLKSLGSIKLIGVKDFITVNPDSGLESYINATHTNKVLNNFDMYIASYIHLYRVYKSFTALVENNYINLVDTFIDHCFIENTDHPGTISYSYGDVNEVLRFRKPTYNIIKKFLVNHGAYAYFLNLNTKHKYTDKQFRQVRDSLLELAVELAVAVSNVAESGDACERVKSAVLVIASAAEGAQCDDGAGACVPEEACAEGLTCGDDDAVTIATCEDVRRAA